MPRRCHWELRGCFQSEISPAEGGRIGEEMIQFPLKPRAKTIEQQLVISNMYLNIDIYIYIEIYIYIYIDTHLFTRLEMNICEYDMFIALNI